MILKVIKRILLLLENMMKAIIRRMKVTAIAKRIPQRRVKIKEVTVMITVLDRIITTLKLPINRVRILLL